MRMWEHHVCFAVSGKGNEDAIVNTTLQHRLWAAEDTAYKVPRFAMKIQTR